MTWSYSGDPASSPKDWIRFRLGEKVQTPQSLSDEELLYLLAQNDNVPYMAASKAAEIMSAAHAATSVTSKQVGSLRLSYGYAETASRYARLAKELAGGETAGLLGMISTDTSDGYFEIGMMDADGDRDRRRL